MSEAKTAGSEATAVEEELAKHPAAASSDEVLALKPNKAADATSGPDEQVSATGYTTWTRPDGSSFIAPVANDETYERKEGFKKGAVQDIPDLVAHLAEQAGKSPAGEKPEGTAHAARGEHAEAPKAKS